jgi:ADP-ribose pyrophosphatase
MSEIRPWKRKASRKLVDCRVFTVSESTSISPRTGDDHTFFYLDTADWVNIVPITVDDEVVFVRQFRHGSEGISLEIPGGMVDPGEDPQVAAVRECLDPNPALFCNKLHTYVARQVEAIGEIANTSTEHTEVELVPMKDLPGLLQSGAIDHALVAATLWRLLYLDGF